MGESRPFQVNVPRAVAEQQWQRFRTLFDTTGVGLPEFEDAGASTTRFAFPAGADLASQERIAAEFARFAESDIDPEMPPETSEPTDSMGNVLTKPPRDSGMPLVGRMASPGAPGAGMNDSAGRDEFPRKPS